MSKTPDQSTINAALDRALAHHPDCTGQVLNVLDEIQREFRYIPEEALVELANRTGIPLTRLHNVCDFFRDFTLDPVGEHLVTVCDGTACHTRGAPDLVKALETFLGIEAGQTTPDGRFTLRTVHCFGACSLAPLMVVDERVFGRVRLNEAAEILKMVG